MIRIDDRTGSKEFEPHLCDLRVPVKVCRLDSADFAFNGKGRLGPVKVGVERKTIPDFVGSYQSGRFTDHQLPRLCRDYDFVILLLEGSYRQTAYGLLEWYSKEKWVGLGMPWTAFEGILHTLTFKAAAQIRHTWGPGETAQLIASLYRWWQKPWDEHESHLKAKVLGPKMNPRTGFAIRRTPQVEKIALTLPGVGVKSARYVARKFHTPVGILKSTRAEWESIPGIGATKAKRIMEALHGSK